MREGRIPQSVTGRLPAPPASEQPAPGRPASKRSAAPAGQSPVGRDTRLRFEQWASNPTCAANTLSAVHNVRMARVAQRAGMTPSFGASPFALVRGQRFEADLLADGAARLLPELRRTGVLPDAATGLCDLRIRANRGSDPSLRDLDDACERTLELLAEAGRARSRRAVERLPAVVAGATLRLPRRVMLPEALLIVDVLALRSYAGSGRAEVVVGEIKTYPDRGGFTEPGALAGARAQLGLYLHALRTVVATLSERDRPRLADHGFLVLARPGSNFPRVRAGEDLRFQAERAARGFDLLEEAAGGLHAPTGNGDPPRPPNTGDLPQPPGTGEPGPAADPLADAVLAAPTRYREACVEFCDLAPRCRDDAAARGEAVILGDEVARHLGRIPIERALALLNGAQPADETEADLAERLRAAEAR
jgi:hypothetical protein